MVSCLISAFIVSQFSINLIKDIDELVLGRSYIEW